MDQLLTEFGLKEGIFAALFIWLFYNTMKRSEDREDKLYTFLDEMKDEFAKLVGSYESLAQDVAEIREDMTAAKIDAIQKSQDSKEENTHVRH